MATQFVSSERYSMAASEKITILLADEDALRRDGLAAVLQANAGYEVVAQCPDGETALLEMRQLHPDVAVIDLNLPKLHGIELVRRVRGEMLGTKIVILAGTADDDIIREVVRAGGDAYLLKNGPARHLVDAISYVRDGGQYFSPQLRRDGVNRHLLEEPARIPPSPAGRSDVEPYQTEDRNGDHRKTPRETPPARDSRHSRSSRPSARVGSRDRGFRDRMRENASSPNLEERDYEILDMMAQGIRPILDRLEEMEGRIVDMERGEAAVPGNVRGWLSTQIADTFHDDSGGGRELTSARSIGEIEARLPKLIEDAVTARFQNMAGKLQQEIEETHLRTLEAFVKNIQVKLVQRVSALETDMSKQAEAMKQLRDYSQRTDDNLSRLISGVDKLAQDLPRRLPPASEPVVQRGIEQPKVSGVEPRVLRVESRKSRRRVSSNGKVLLFWAALIAIVIAIVANVKFASRRPKDQPPVTAQSPSGTGASATAAQKPIARLAPGADTKTRMQAAENYTERKEYTAAEDIYKQILQTEPNNVDAMKALASVLYREDKIEESAAVLEKLPKSK